MTSIQMPFTAEQFLGVVKGKEMVLGRNIQPSTGIENSLHVWFDDKSFSGMMKGKWSVEQGLIILTDEWNKPLFVFRGMETRNESVFLTGEPLIEAQVSGFIRAVMYEYLPLNDKFRICISSHVDYGDALDRIWRSLVRIGFPKDRVLTVIGGSKPTEFDVDGWDVKHVSQSCDGFTALTCLPDDWDGYWLLLHDTCEVNDDFVEKISKLDVGLNYDVVFVAPSPCELGLYSSGFVGLLNQQSVLSGKFAGTFKGMVSSARVWTNKGDSPRKAATKDVYGTGIKRDVLYIDSIGIKKYRRVAGVAKP